MWLLWNDEPYLTDQVDKFYFNWTLSYKYSSEVSYCSYGCFIERENIIDETLLKKLIKIDYSKRKNSALWFLSNCASHSRNSFVIKLSKFYNNIHVFGKCNNVLLANNTMNAHLEDSICDRNSECERHVSSTSMFYLSLESTNCDDYITEKFWRSLSFNLIPVVIQPSRKFYDRIAAPNSFLHFEDFNNDEIKLAAYLNKIANSFELYYEHVKWKQSYQSVYKDRVVEQQRICELCYRLNTEQKVDYYKNVSSFFNSVCKENL